MKIGLVASNFYPDLVGGAEYYTWNISKELLKLGHEIHVFTQETPKNKNKFNLPPKLFLHPLKSYGFFYRLKWWTSLEAALRKSEPEVLIVLDYAQLYTFKALKFARWLSIPCCLMINDVHSLKIGRHPLKHRPLEIYDALFIPRLFLKFDRILVRTNWTKQYLIRKYPELKEKLAVTPSGLTAEEFLPGRVEAFANKFKLTTEKIILFLGRIRKQKGIFDLLKAFTQVKKEIPDAKLVYAGPDEKAYDGLEFTPKLKKNIAEEKIKDVTFLGPIYDKDKNNALAAASVMCLPSSFENYGQSYAQALAQGTPVVGTYGGGIPEIVSRGVDGYLVNFGDTEKLAFYLIKLLKNPELGKRMGETGRRKVQKYHYTKLAEEFDSLLKSLK